MKSKMTTEKRLRAGMITVIILSICLVMTSYALMSVTLDIKNNRFFTGAININLNDGNPIISIDDGFLFEPGMLVERPFFIENISTDKEPSTGPVYYQIYFGSVNGPLAEALEVTVTSEELSDLGAKTAETFFASGDRRHDNDRVKGTILYHGKMSEMTRNHVKMLRDPVTANDVLSVGERRNLYMYFYLPPETGNEAMRDSLEFSIYADAVQTKNNQGIDFGEVEETESSENAN